MSTALVVVALVIAIVSVPTVAGMTAWGLAGGDGSPDTPLHGVLAVMVGGGSLYNALTCYAALFEIATWQWWLMWLAPAAGIAGVLLAVLGGELEQEDTTFADVIAGLGFQAILAVPVVLVGLSDAV